MLKKFAQNLQRQLQKIIFPRHCLICNCIITEGQFCAMDWNELQFLQPPACSICFHPFTFKIDDEMLCGVCLQKKPPYQKARSLFKYDEFSAALIAKFKYNDGTFMAKYLAEMMFNQSRDLLQSVDFIAPVPLHKSKLISRKFNQSALLANKMQKLSAVKNINDLLLRVKQTKAQTTLNKEQRQKNIAGAFILNEKYRSLIQGKNILLIDDVITTGATIESCCTALLKNGAGKIYVQSIAKRVLD